MANTEQENNLFDSDRIGSVLLRIAPPVMAAQLIQSLYNIVDSYFVGQFSAEGLTALSILFPIQLVITAIAVGTGVGVNTLISRYDGQGRHSRALSVAGTGTMLAFLSWLLFALISGLLLAPFVHASTQSARVAEEALTYGYIVCIGSIGVFLEGTWTKVHQARGNMRLPMAAQVAGALTNIVLDPLLIFGLGPFPALGIAGAAYATVAGQMLAALITASALHRPPVWREARFYIRRIYQLGYPSILMQTLYTVYIIALNLILAGFSDQAVTVLGLYYKIQSFFFIPLAGLQTCIVPFLSYTYAKKAYRRCQGIIRFSILLAMSLMLVGVACFELIPQTLLRIFSSDAQVLAIGVPAFRIIGISFIPAVLSLIFPVFFQAIGQALSSVLLSLTRQILCLIPLFWLLSKISLTFSWAAFPLAETITGILSLILYFRCVRDWNIASQYQPQQNSNTQHLKMLIAIIHHKNEDAVCAALTTVGYPFTRTASIGAFLSGGSCTLFIGTAADRVQPAIQIIRAHCSRRAEPISSDEQPAVPTDVGSPQVTVSGATIFVTDVSRFEKI